MVLRFIGLKFWHRGATRDGLLLLPGDFDWFLATPSTVHFVSGGCRDRTADVFAARFGEPVRVA